MDTYIEALLPFPTKAFSKPSAQVDVNPHASEAADASATFAAGVDVEQPPYDPG